MQIKKKIIIIISCFLALKSVSGIELSENSKKLIKNNNRIAIKKGKIVIYEQDNSRRNIFFGVAVLGGGGLIYSSSRNTFDRWVGGLLAAVGTGIIAYGVDQKTRIPKKIIVLDDEGITLVKQNRKMLWADVEDVINEALSFVQLNSLYDVCFSNGFSMPLSDYFCLTSFWFITLIRKIDESANMIDKIAAKGAERNITLPVSFLPLSSEEFISLIAEYLNFATTKNSNK